MLLTAYHPTGRVLSAEETMAYNKKNGICTNCGLNRTHVKSKRGFSGKRMVPREEVMDDKGRLIVYKGVCMFASCYSHDNAKNGILQDAEVKPLWAMIQNIQPSR